MSRTQPPNALAGIPRNLIDGAACKGHDLNMFFPESELIGAAAVMRSYTEAKSLCAACPIRSGCLAGALDRGEAWGVWGSTTPKERYQLRKTRRAGSS